MTDENPQADPGNSDPSSWTEDMTAEEIQAVKDRLAEGAAQPDFVVGEDGVPVSTAKTPEELAATFVEPAPVPSDGPDDDGVLAGV